MILFEYRILMLFSQVEVRITAPLQWGARPGEGAGFHLLLDSGERDNASELTENLEVRIPSEEVLEALESIRRARSNEERTRPEFRVRHRIRYNQSITLFK